MSNEENKEEQKDPNHKLSNEEERKKQFERMKEKFGKQNSPFGGQGNKGGISCIVTLALSEIDLENEAILLQSQEKT